MRDMNLLPREYIRKSSGRYLFPIVIVLCLSVWPAAWFGYFLPVEIRAAKTQDLASLQAEADKLPELEESFRLQKADLEVLESRAHAFQETEMSTPLFWQCVISSLTDSLPAGTAIQDFTCDNTSILLSGISRSDITAAKYLRSLQSSGYFSDVRMEKIQYRNDSEISFQLNCTLKSNEDESNPDEEPEEAAVLSDSYDTGERADTQETEGLVP